MAVLTSQLVADLILEFLGGGKGGRGEGGILHVDWLSSGTTNGGCEAPGNVWQ